MKIQWMLLSIALPLAAQNPAVQHAETHHDVVILGSPGVMIGGPVAQKGAPYSAESITESVQTLADGNRIRHTNTMMFYRDSEGRTRRETSLQSFGRVGKSDEPQKTITIEDPVAGVHYMLNPSTKSAHKIMTRGGAPGSANGKDVFMMRVPPPGAGNGPETISWTAADPAAAGQIRVTRSETTRISSVSSSNNVKRENLGNRMIEGVSATGTRAIITIPAGEAGNEQPIEIVTETWFSDQIKSAVLTIHKDPRHGETTTKLVNIRLGEPAANLFEVPPGFTLDSRGPGMFERKIQLHKSQDEI